MNKEITSSMQVNQWKNSSAIMKWFRNIENKPKLFIYHIRHPGLWERNLQLLNDEISIIMQLRKTLHSAMLKNGLKKMTNMILMYQWAATMEQRCVSWLAYIC